jgi:hypothetical protein
MGKPSRERCGCRPGKQTILGSDELQDRNRDRRKEGSDVLTERRSGPSAKYRRANATQRQG